MRVIYNNKTIIVTAMLVMIWMTGIFVNGALRKNPPIEDNPGTEYIEGKILEELNPETTNVTVSQNEAIEAVEYIWSVPSKAEVRGRLIRDNLKSETYWEIYWDSLMDPQCNLLFAKVDANTGEVLDISGRSYATVDNLKNETKAVEIALKLVEELGVDQTLLSEPMVLQMERLGEIRYRVRWGQVYKGIPIWDGWISVYINPEILKPGGFDRCLLNVEGVNIVPSISESEVVEAAKVFITSKLGGQGFKVEGVVGATLMICRPNYIWTWLDTDKRSQLGAPTLTWIVTLNTYYPFGVTQPIWVWVDAHNGHIVGGDILR